MTITGEQPEDIAAFAELAKAVGIQLCAEDVMDILWLASQTGPLPPPVQRPPQQAEDTDTVTVVEGEDLPPLSERIPLRPRGQDTPAQETNRRSSRGMPIAVPAAPALRTQLALGRALRPLMRKVAALNRTYLDEEATATQIAEQEVWLPVLRPRAERWLELALVIEEAPSLPIWQSVIRELQLLMERQGAFRTVQPWRLTATEQGQPQLFPGSRAPRSGQRPRSPKELIDPAGRRLIVVVSDCTSDLWRRGRLHGWLRQWSQSAPVTLLQLFPQRLWERSALGQGSPVWLRSFGPGLPTHYWQVESPLDFLTVAEPQPDTAPTLAIPVVTLESSSLAPWARVMVGTGAAKATGVQFAPTRLAPEAPADEAVDAKTLVRQFRAGASIQAQQLAGLMASVPVSPDIADLIRETLLPEAQQVHVAEVFMGGLVRMTRTPRADKAPLVTYDFVSDKVRDLLTDAVAVPKTAAVLDAVSAYLSARLNLSTRSLEALLVPNAEVDAEGQDQVRPFAALARRTLCRLGRDYAQWVEQLEAGPEPTSPTTPSPATPSGFPPFKTFEFEVARFVAAAEAWPPLQTKDFEVVTVNVVMRTPQEQALMARIAEMASMDELSAELLASAELASDYTSTPLTEGADLLELFEQPEVDQRLLILGEPGAGKTTLLRALAARLLERAEQDPTAPIPILLNLASWQAPQQPMESMEDWLVGQLKSQYSVNRQLAQTWLSNRQLLPLLDGLDELSEARFQPVIEGINQGLADMALPGLVVCSRVFEYDEFHRVPLRLNAAIRLAPPVLSVFEFETATLQKQEQRGFLGLGRRQVQWQIRKQRRQGRCLVERLGDELTLEMVCVPAGEFLMGAPDDEPDHGTTETPQHRVTVGSFLMGRYGVTQAQWRFVAELAQVDRALDPSPARFKGDNRPVERVSWQEAVEICARLSAHTGREYRLPTEAEWEYACRAGTITPFSFGETITTDLANYRGTADPYNGGPKGPYREQTTDAGQFPANAFGLYDMHGNVWEWCQDVWHGNYKDAPTDGSAWLDGRDSDVRVLRGGSWNNGPWTCRSACRHNSLGVRNSRYGFRVVCSAPR
jgi:formylglycine-generating enzyme required for sulfatase activity